MELLSEVRTPAQVLNFALSRERGQENQRKTLQSHSANSNEVNATSTKAPMKNSSTSERTNKQTHKKSNHVGDVEHPSSKDNNVCPAKQAQCNICKEMGHYAKPCRSKRPEKSNQRQPQ